jgi:hypothetical protein
MFLGLSSTKFLFFVPVGYSIGLPGPIICSDWLKFQRSSSLKLMNWLNPNCKWMIIWNVLYQFSVFYVDRKSKMATTATLTLNLMGKCSNTFFSETTDMIKAKLYMNVHWMVLYKLFLDFFLFKSIIEFMYSIEIIFLSISKEVLIKKYWLSYQLYLWLSPVPNKL